MLQRLTILERNDSRLVLRELPYANWFYAGVLVLLAFVLAFANLMITAVVALVIGIGYGALSSVQYIVFDKVAGTMSVVRQGLRQRETVSTLALAEIVMAYLLVDREDNATQALLILPRSQLGLSTYSRFGHLWKQEIVMAINEFLQVDLTRLQERLEIDIKRS